jgi:hypothetical protein
VHRLQRSRWWPGPLRLQHARQEMAARSTERLEVRQACLDAVRQVRVATAAAAGSVTGPVWQYWDTGIDTAPPLVRRCLQSVQEHLPGPVLRLSDDTIGDHVSLPGYVSRRDISRTHLSDILRLHLLAEHGGMWVDATVLVTGGPPSDVDASPFFAFARPADPFLLSSWFLRATPGHPLVVAWRDALDAYWAASSTQSDYFLLHHLFEALVTYHQPLRAAWTAVPGHSFREPHFLQDAMLLPYDAQVVEAALAASWLHKLTYRYPHRGEHDPVRVVDALLGPGTGPAS